MKNDLIPATGFIIMADTTPAFRVFKAAIARAFVGMNTTERKSHGPMACTAAGFQPRARGESVCHRGRYSGNAL